MQFAPAQPYAASHFVGPMPVAAMVPSPLEGCPPAAWDQGPVQPAAPLILSTSPSRRGREPPAKASPVQQHRQKQQHQQEQHGRTARSPREAPRAGGAAAAALSASRGLPGQVHELDKEPARPRGAVAAAAVAAALAAVAEPDDVESAPSEADRDGSRSGDAVADAVLASPFRVRHTFLDFPAERSPSLERFFEERKCRSSPTSRPPSGPPSRPRSREPRPAAGALSLLAPEALVAKFERMPSEAPSFPIATPTSSGAMTPRDGRGHRGEPAAVPAPMVLRLSEVIATDAKCGASRNGSACSTAVGSALIPSSEPSGPQSALIPGDAARTAAADIRHPPGSAELPSRGSALHHWGACKPCAFVFAEGCSNAAECQFCHLCEPGEKKRRRKERRKFVAASSQPR